MRAHYIRNMVALWEGHPKLAMLIDSVPEERLPPLVATRDGNWTVRVPVVGADGGEAAGGTGGTGGVLLHSAYRPIEEAARWVDAAGGLAEKYVVIVSGFALGYHVRALWEKLGDEALLIVAEPNVPLLAQALRLADYSDIFRSRCFFLFTTLDRGDLVERLEPRAALMLSGTQLLQHDPSMRVQSGFHNAFGKLVTDFVYYTRTSYYTLMLNNVTTCRNIANNLGRYVTTPALDALHNSYTGVPAILVAAGPSLAKNVQLLKEVRDGKRRAVIIAVQTMLKPLLALGIEPDFVTSLDYNPISTQFFENLGQAGSTGRVHLVAEAKANWQVLDVFTRQGGEGGVESEGKNDSGGEVALSEGTMSLAANEFADKLLRDAEAGLAAVRMGVKAGATVAHLSFYLAEFLGCDPIILVGQDLGFVNGLYYKPGTAIHETWAAELGRFNTLETKEWERISRSKALLRKIPDIHGQPMYTEEQFFVYLQQFERDFAASRCRVIDATEGGARKQHVTLRTLREALDEFCQNSPSAGSADARISDRWKHWACDRPGRLQAAHDALARRRAECAALKATCVATVPLLEEMITCQQDEARMGELFVEVDRLRSKVGQDQVIFEIVCNLNTIGELRRFQHDLSVKAAQKDTLERQKRQLLRDIDYVKNLNIGCDRLLEILAEASGRLERQLESVRQGAPWPVEMAGAGVASSHGAAGKGNSSA